MATKIHGAGGKKTNEKTTQKANSPSNQEKKEPKQADLTKKIKSLEDDKKKLTLENVMFQKKFDLKEVIKALSTKGITEVDANEIAKDMVKKALEEEDKKHSAEKAEMEKKHKKEIEELRKNLQGEDQLPTKSKALDEEKIKHANYITELESKHKGEIDQLKRNFNGRDQMPTDLSGDGKHSQEADKEIAKILAQNKKLEGELGSLKAEKDELNNNIKLLTTEKESLKKKLEETEVLLRQKETEIKNMEKDVNHVQTREKSMDKHLEKEETRKDVNHSHQGGQDTISKTVNPEDIQILMRETTKEIEKAANSEKNALLADIQKLQDENKKQKESYEKINKQKENEKNALLADIQKLQDENKKQKESYEKINKQKENEKNALLADIQKLQDENMKQKESYEKINKQKEKEKEALLAENQTKDSEIKTLQNENKALKQSEEKNKNLNEKLKKVKAKKDDLKQQVTALQKENDEVKYRLKESQSPSLSNVISSNDTKAVQQLQKENERLRTRLSEMAGAQMTLNNPNIADLSDAFRPTKLSEEYSQLYDNLWTDAFEEHGREKEEDIIQILGNTLLGSYKFCENVCREFTAQLTNSSLSLPNSNPKTEDIPIVYKKQLQDMKKSFGVFLMKDVKESYRKENTIQGGEKTKNYIDACVELCWLMVLQEPPVVIERPASKDSAFDSDTYRTYTKTGTKVDFVVWPALRLHQGGPLLTKGVAQGKN